MAIRPQVVTYLTGEEHARLLQMMASELTGCETKSEFIRMLLAREWHRRKNLPKPNSSWASANRKGRPFGKKKAAVKIWPHEWNGFSVAV